ncbi:MULTISPECIES: hypothetical protein [unclassified Imperialibacter]|uniref:hypothetical protein n=1 Tax=unclassified Imperialibacter TaxID=2629706 RepID=UPI001257A526|nr:MULTISPECIES: hypothetical protein [unclassified Imperialibacter]CAD5255123.1 exported hypothetical protein [Imperialibacter sp. 89]CAD5256464.1 exported hypothetical protein [Imperialibacter sp. 75]VVT20195.1 exported hypothetical protein [Imperialibacter sp. EC-SDR9]
MILPKTSLTILALLAVSTLFGQTKDEIYFERFIANARNYLELDWTAERMDNVYLYGLGNYLRNFDEPSWFREPANDSISIRLIYHESWKKSITIRISGYSGSYTNWEITVKKEGDNSVTIEDFYLDSLTNKERRQLNSAINNSYQGSSIVIDNIYRKAAISDSVRYKFTKLSQTLSKVEIEELLQRLDDSNFYELAPINFHPSIIHGTTCSVEVLQPTKNYHLVMQHIVLDEHVNFNHLVKFILELANKRRMIETDLNDW